MSPRYKVVVVGTGIGRAHLRAYQSLPALFEVVAVCAAERSEAQTCADEFGIPLALEGIDEACAADADIVDICTPPYLHAEHASKALIAGKHAICEKPLAGSLHDVDALIAAEAASGRRLMPIFQYRFGHAFQKLKRLREAGVTGRALVTAINVHWRRRAPYYDVPWRGHWQTELGGALTGHAIHALDMLTYIIGPVRSVYARIATRVNDIEVEDCAAVVLEMADGSLATLSLTLGSAPEESRHRFVFENLVAESNTRPYDSSGEPWTFTPDTPEAGAAIEAALAGFTPEPEVFAGQFARYHRALATGGPLPVTLADARASIELLTAMYASAATNRPVELPIERNHPMYSGWQSHWLNAEPDAARLRR
ncbi:MAG: Gfo/Idh/MocA family oxidoreductase [Anaerolineae bacterium]|nr:Gfo/Idh/MocA family oxidoreductase [Candidatus Roseilinea sp.]MDW8448642.1 Gfo/Idh/MocA family oxidoreductase [Anaerolineae bacterium]